MRFDNHTEIEFFDDPSQLNDADYDGPGWYYCYSMPGYMPDSPWYGPYGTALEAVEEAVVQDAYNPDVYTFWVIGKQWDRILQADGTFETKQIIVAYDLSTDMQLANDLELTPLCFVHTFIDIDEDWLTDWYQRNQDVKFKEVVALGW